MADWQPIETAPRVRDERILASSAAFGDVMVVSWAGTKKREKWVDDVGLCSFGPGMFTHWMPLPEPPKP